jgi:hypothetical protein
MGPDNHSKLPQLPEAAPAVIACCPAQKKMNNDGRLAGGLGGGSWCTRPVCTKMKPGKSGARVHGMQQASAAAAKTTYVLATAQARRHSRCSMCYPEGIGGPHYAVHPQVLGAATGRVLTN